MARRPPTVAVPVASTALDAAETAALLRTFSDFVWKTDAEGRLATDMPQWRAITGQTPDELLGSGWLAGVHPDDRDRVMATWQGAVEARAVYDVEYRITGEAGERWYHARAAPVAGEDGEPTHWVGTVNDVTEHHVAETAREALQEDLDRERRLLEQVIAEAPTAIAITWGPQHRYRFWNRHYLDLVPAGRLTTPGTSVLEAFPEAEEVVALLDRVLLGEPAPIEELALPFAGPGSFQGHRYYQGALLPVLQDGRPGGVLIVAHEVTEQVRRREDLAERLRHERQAAERLQRALLPEAPPVIEGLEVALRYLPAEQGLVGGDWYDVVDLGDGRVLLVIGDVCGHGLEAAAWMSQLRAAVRAYAVEDPTPTTLLGRLATFSARLGLPDMVSVGAGLLDLGAGRLAWASAGHPAPLVLQPGHGCVEPAGPVTGPPLGLGGPYAETGIALGPGAGLVLFTDGAVEDRGTSIAEGIAALCAAAPDAEVGAQAVCDALAAHVAGRGVADDDVALLVVRRPDGRGRLRVGQP